MPIDFAAYGYQQVEQHRRLWVKKDQLSKTFTYNDGDEFETWVGDVVRNASDVSRFSPELNAGIRDWPSLYHLSSSRANLILPLIDKIRGPVLELGAGMGAITRALGEHGFDVVAVEGSFRRASICTDRCRDLPNVCVVNDTIQDFSTNVKFSTVVMIGVLEYSRAFGVSKEGVDPVSFMLQHVRSFLEPNGQIIIAIENQLGLKYLAGAPEDHLGRGMVGVEDRYKHDGVVTFGREELRKYLVAAGLAEQDWYYPFPDYKLPVSIFPERALQSESYFDISPLLVTSTYDLQQSKRTSFDVDRVLSVVARNNVISDLANSFLVRVSSSEIPKEDTVLAWYFGAGNRRPEFLKITTFENTEQGVFVRRRPATVSSGTLIKGIEIVHKDEQYYLGRPWIDQLKEFVAYEGWTHAEIVKWFSRWLRHFFEIIPEDVMKVDNPLIPGDYLDAIPRNLVVNGDGAKFIDLEWTSVKELPLKYIVFRAAYDSLKSLKHVAKPKPEISLIIWDLLKVMLENNGFMLSDQEIAQQWHRERAFQATVLDSDAPLEVSVYGALGTSLEVYNGFNEICTDAEKLSDAALTIQGLRETETALRGEFDKCFNVAQKEKEDLRQQLEALRQQLATIQGTLSWRLTSPLRAASRFKKQTSKNPFISSIMRTQRGIKRKTENNWFNLNKGDNDNLNVSYYRSRNPDLEFWSDGDLISHFHDFGQAEGRPGLSVYEESRITIRSIDPDRETVFVILPDATRTDIPILGWNLVRELEKTRNVVAILLRSGELVAVLEESASATVTITSARPFDILEERFLAEGMKERFNPVYAIAISSATHGLVLALELCGVPVVGLIHEFSSSMRPVGILGNFLGSTSVLMFPAEIVAQSMKREYGVMLARDYKVIPQGNVRFPDGEGVNHVNDVRRGADNVIVDLPEYCLDEFLNKLNEDAVLVLGAGTIAPRKGVEFFLQAARKTIENAPNLSIAFAWIGERLPESQWYVEEIWEQVNRSNIESLITFISPGTNWAKLYERTDIFFLSSRLDPFPNIVINAALASIPVIAFRNASGFAEWVDENALLRELVVDYLDSSDAASKILALANDKDARGKIGTVLREYAERKFDMEVYVSTIDELGHGARKLVEKAKQDLDYILATGEFDPQFFLGSDSSGDLTAAVRSYLMSSRIVIPRKRPRSGLIMRRPAHGFNPLVYAERASDYNEFCDGDPFADYLRRGKPEGPWKYNVIEFQDGCLPTQQEQSFSIILHGHFHYPELIFDLLPRLETNVCTFRLYFTTSSVEKAAILEDALDKSPFNDWSVDVVFNRGRDFGPLLSGLGWSSIEKYDLLWHIHGKRSPHLDASVANRWNSFLWENLIGGKHPMLDRILLEFESDRSLGLVYPEDPHLSDWDLNRDHAESLLERLGISESLPNHFDFPVGNMFCARTDALRPMFEANFQWHEFPEEPVGVDGTMLHALERLTPFVVEKCGYRAARTAVAGVAR